MNNAIMYDYYSYGDSSSEKGDTQEKNEEEDPNSQDAKLKRLMKEKGISIDEEDVDEDEPGTNKESEDKSEGALKVGEQEDTAQRKKSGESTRSGKKPASKSKQSRQTGQEQNKAGHIEQCTPCRVVTKKASGGNLFPCTVGLCKMHMLFVGVL